MTAILELSDDGLREWGEIGGMELRFTGRWDRMENVLAELDHDPVRFRWTYASQGEPALFIEVPVSPDEAPERLVELGHRVREAVAAAPHDYVVHVTFVDRSRSDDKE